MAYTRGTRYRDGCAGGERGSTTAARAVCAEVLQVVHGAFVRLAHVGGCAMVAEAVGVCVEGGGGDVN